MKPLISVIIPAYNSAETIGPALQSIIDQTYPKLEIMVIDDNSTDNTAEVVKRYVQKDERIHYYALPFNDPYRINKRGRNINAGYMARNFGFEKSQGEWITFQDADDASFRNRIEVQYNLAIKYNAWHVCLDWQKFNEAYINKKFNTEKIFHDHSLEEIIVSRDEIYNLSQKTKGLIIPYLGPLNALIPFEWKRLRFINKLFFSSLEQYPGTGNSPLFKREILKKVYFRKLQERIWPSFMGRGADRDFNFQVAETFKQSMTFRLPLYLWRSDHQNERYRGYEKYIEK
jgi:glycosyltransferase involved in cell wall biosynthesis